MSPLNVRRYRAERLLRKEFEGLRTNVLATVRRRLSSRGVALDTGDIEACYAQAWQGLYAAVLDGQEIANPTGWLVLVTFRRAIEDYRSSHPEHRAAEVEPDEQGAEPDLASQMDDHRRLRQVFEALRERLSERECQAASLCYLQGLSRAEAAQNMGISESRMRKLMEGNGPGRLGVAGKMGELLSIIRAEGWCEERSSLMRGFAFGILDTEGERYQLALIHQRGCPACRAYVASLRGLAAVLPMPVFLPGLLGAGVLAGTGAGVGAGTGAGAGAGAQAGAGVGGALSASGTATAGAGAGAAGGGWLLAGGSVGAKLAVGCLLALGVGCVALTVNPDHGRVPTHRHHSADGGGTDAARAAGAAGVLTPDYLLTGAVQGVARPGGAASGQTTSTLTPASMASREFGLERAFAQSTSSSSTASSSSRGEPSARAASAGSTGSRAEFTSIATPASGGQPTTPRAPSSSDATSSGATGAGGNDAQREFGIG
jgi:RNA polymerase sigma factor (sigma-70 family)